MIENIQITPEMLNLISEIDQFKSVWQWVNKIEPDRLSALKKVATIESIGSSTRIEGSKLSDREVEELLSRVDIESFQKRDEQEVAGYAFACEQIINIYEKIPISENSIKQLHSWVLNYSEKDERHRGEYKKVPIKIEAFDAKGKHIGTIFETVSPMETPIKMKQLVDWTNLSIKEKKLHPLIIIGLFVVVFLAIHPFQDGNGRLSRLLTTLLMLKAGYRYVPYSSMESIIEANKESYYLALQRSQKSWQNHNPNWTPWLTFFLQCLKRQKVHLETKLSKEKMLIPQMTPLERSILRALKMHGPLKIGELEKLTKANRSTLKKTLSLMVKNRSIVLNGTGKSTFYSLV